MMQGFLDSYAFIFIHLTPTHSMLNVLNLAFTCRALISNIYNSDE